MIHHDGYNEKELSNDLENSKNVELRFIEYMDVGCTNDSSSFVKTITWKEGKKENYQYATGLNSKISNERGKWKEVIVSICPIY